MKKSRKKYLLLIPGLLLAAILVSLWCSKYSLTVSRYSVSSEKISHPFRVVQLTDLHNSLFGENNTRLVKRVTAEDPDLILITGDLLNQKEERTDVALDLIRQLSAAAPVYVSRGNHEAGYEKKFGGSLNELYREAGATVLSFNWQEVEVRGQTVRLGGFYGYALPRHVYEGERMWPKEYEYLTDFEKSEDFKILMCHMPVAWIRYGSLESWDIDCIFAGHDHGGQIRIPFVGGMWAPDQGWFPGRECGLYFSKDGQHTMVLSRGLGNTDKYPRFNNIPEIVTVDFLPADGEQ